jgi:NhaC family Na+:H+ antiporter
VRPCASPGCRGECIFQPTSPEDRALKFIHALLPILVLTLLIVIGLIVGPLAFGQPSAPLEILFMLAAAFAVAHLLAIGIPYADIQDSVVRKLASALPAFFILFTIGIIIAAWMISGTIPMLVYWGLQIVDPAFLYVTCFLVPILFSMLTGTSWGSVGTVGVVLIGITGVLNAHLGIAAGAIIGGAYFGDKLSPLSDTTNMAALATGVDLYDHIRSMMVTTIPSALLAAAAFTVLGFTHGPLVANATAGADVVGPFMASLRTLFDFNILLLLPPVIVLVGSALRKPIIPVLISSVIVAAVEAAIFQQYAVIDILIAMNRGFSVDMATWAAEPLPAVAALVNRGGLYSMSEAIFVAFLIFFFIGAIDTINAMPTVVNRVFAFARSRSTTILSALGASALTNALTSNQYATSFIVGDAFVPRFRALRIPPKVLSRSIEDYGTMIESIVPWHASAVFMAATLGVPWAAYWPWQLMTLINLVVAALLAITGIGCFYHEVDAPNPDATGPHTHAAS